MFFFLFYWWAEISIHAPRVGSDKWLKAKTLTLTNFNPRSPRGERPERSSRTASVLDFNPRSPRGERHSSSALP